MTRSLAAIIATALLVVRQLLCGHPGKLCRPLLIRPDGRKGFACHCPNCKANWLEYPR